MLNLVLVRAFLAVAEEGSFHAAARRLGVAQPTLSQQVRKLEQQLGRPLIARRRAGCVPTAHGHVLLPYAHGLLATAERARLALDARGLAVGASSNIGIYLLQPLIRRFAEAEGMADGVDLRIDRNPGVADRLERGEIDVAVMEWWDDRPGFRASVWRREPLVAIVPPDHQWAALDAVDADRLLGTPMLGGEPGTGTGRVLVRAFGDRTRRIAVTRNLGSTEAVKAAVKAGMGVSLVLAGAVEEEVAAGTLAALPVRGATLLKDLYVVVPDNTPPGTPAVRFACHLVAEGLAAAA